jgi:Arc/MetJ-type ribon-helix-helix transcriptional regulator
MTISLHHKFELFVQSKVEAGEFSTPQEVIEAALLQMMSETMPDRLDANELPELRKSLAQMRRGETGNWNELSAELRSKHLVK